MCSIILFEEVSEFLSSSDLKTKFIPLLTKAASDKIPNVRFSAARAMFKLKEILSESEFTELINPILEQIGSDEDLEVQYYVSKCKQ